MFLNVCTVLPISEYKMCLYKSTYSVYEQYVQCLWTVHTVSMNSTYSVYEQYIQCLWTVRTVSMNSKQCIWTIWWGESTFVLHASSPHLRTDSIGDEPTPCINKVVCYTKCTRTYHVCVPTRNTRPHDLIWCESSQFPRSLHDIPGGGYVFIWLSIHII